MNSPATLAVQRPPLVSVLMSAYRQPAFLNEAIRSVARQTYQSFEITVVDDASGPEFVQQYQLPPGAKLIVHPDRLATAAINRNQAIQASSGKYIAFLDQDDVWLPDKLAWQVDSLERQPEAVLTFGHYRRVAENLQEMPDQPRPWTIGKDPLKQLIRRNIIHCPSQVMMRRAALERIGMFDESIRGAADWDMWVRAAAAGPIVADPRVMVLYRHHPNQWSRQNLMTAKGSLCVMEHAAQWAVKQRPDLASFIRRRQARWTRELARIQMQSADERQAAYATLQQAVKLWPYAVRPYLMMWQARKLLKR